MTDAAAEFVRLLEAWDTARKSEAALTGNDSPATRQKARQITEFSHAKLVRFQQQQAEAFDIMVRCKMAICPDGDTSLEMVLGDSIRASLEHRLTQWQQVATELTRQVEMLKREVAQLKRSRQEVTV
jgi:hypothetical protein